MKYINYFFLFFSIIAFLSFFLIGIFNQINLIIVVLYFNSMILISNKSLNIILKNLMFFISVTIFIYLIYFLPHFQNYFDDFCCLDCIFYSNIETENGIFSLIFDVWRVGLSTNVDIGSSLGRSWAQVTQKVSILAPKWSPGGVISTILGP